ncbi:tryptophan synthase subunit alpha [Candidatus Aerophobetes bacterium]|nr:tryptophan synthase subunit alpha [Candidatus Aerophobetes bacterium]
MNRINEVFDELKREGRKALICFITLGYPDLKSTEELIFEFEKRGVDIIELGIPFSDPLADGPVIQYSSQEALRKGVSLKKAVEFVKKVRRKTSIPLVFMGYYNPIFKFGEKLFIDKALEAGVDGLILADLPPEEAGNIIPYARERNFPLIFLLTPVSSDYRIKLICRVSEGFVYCVSYTGVTGRGYREEDLLRKFIKKTRSYTEVPLCIGFGISSPFDAEKLSSFADGVIVGSAIIKRIRENENREDMIYRVGEFVLSLSRAIRKNSLKDIPEPPSLD